MKSNEYNNYQDLKKELDSNDENQQLICMQKLLSQPAQFQRLFTADSFDFILSWCKPKTQYLLIKHLTVEKEEFQRIFSGHVDRYELFRALVPMVQRLLIEYLITQKEAFHFVFTYYRDLTDVLEAIEPEIGLMLVEYVLMQPDEFSRLIISLSQLQSFIAQHCEEPYRSFIDGTAPQEARNKLVDHGKKERNKLAIQAAATIFKVVQRQPKSEDEQSLNTADEGLKTHMELKMIHWLSSELPHELIAKIIAKSGSPTVHSEDELFRMACDAYFVTDEESDTKEPIFIL